MAECYYFDENGYMAAGTTLPDGSNVNHWGAWNIKGRDITRSVPVDMGEDSQNYADDFSGTYQVPFYESADDVTYHTVVLTYDPEAERIHYSDLNTGYTETYVYFTVGMNGWISFRPEHDEEQGAMLFSSPGIMQVYCWDRFSGVRRS